MSRRQGLTDVAISCVEQELMDTFKTRVERYYLALVTGEPTDGFFSAGIAGLREMRVAGASGDEALIIPVLVSLDALDGLAPDERFALTRAQRVFDTRINQRSTHWAFEATGPFDSEMVRTLDVISPKPIMIMPRTAGG